MPEIPENDLEQQMMPVAGAFEISCSPLSGSFREALSARIAVLMSADPTRLISILYRLDIPEKKLAALSSQAGLSPEAIADLIISRQVEKAVSRNDNRSAAGKEEGDWWKE